MGKFDGYLICTDLDGTLLRKDKSVSKENLEAIEYFKNEGGKFTFITGRMPFYAGDISNLIRPNAPIGCSNGGGLYDCAIGEYIWKQPIDNRVMELVECVDKSLPDVGIHVSTFYKAYFSKDSSAMKHFRQVSKIPDCVCHYNDVKETIAKIIFATDVEEEIKAVEKLLNEHPMAEKFSFIRSDKTLFEILPMGIGKGMAITKLREHYGEKIIAVGDYNNDISMFEAADIGIAVSNACPEALAAADYVTVSNQEHAIASIVSDIEKGKFI